MTYEFKSITFRKKVNIQLIVYHLFLNLILKCKSLSKCLISRDRVQLLYLDFILVSRFLVLVTKITPIMVNMKLKIVRR